MDIMEVKKQIALFNEGDNILHEEFGPGKIISKGKTVVDADFNGETKKLNLDVLVKSGKIQKND
ncbi:hypothetical protein PP175_06555 [Aneurinibacillus sp. Ricciae_BoGa-3]|uniref:hypothetical protein n=1 Tax=Aneurinibacillus sp. Ricciae_BoGa-3 TaxID=3022697 RepID=UPI0023400B13|nr:hypothetical protein [Aneurinibacillus sp. Ricciae_BoGa-3]WCK55600.1 hypothetical protein PP175_06555 [Aneurinibacillus sp. Ricciae_BoGa-3]